MGVIPLEFLFDYTPVMITWPGRAADDTPLMLYKNLLLYIDIHRVLYRI